MVSDPGYRMFLVTREKRAVYRLREFGAISYVVALTNSDFIELTQEYVPVDTIIIRVLEKGKPLCNARIQLKHKFTGKYFALPALNRYFYTNCSGYVVIHLGALNYNKKAEPVEKFYKIFVNDMDTGVKVTSTGSGLIHFIEIDLSNLNRDH